VPAALGFVAQEGGEREGRKEHHDCAAPDEVFAHISDVRNDPSWHTDVLEVRSSTDDVRVGTVFDVRVKPSMGISKGTMTVSRLEPGRLVEFRGDMSGRMRPTVTNICGPDGAGDASDAPRGARATRPDACHEPADRSHDRQEQRKVPREPEASDGFAPGDLGYVTG
jgi:Polyketide cyclase / dehydrase and lipid transport